jgi:hypothetical protein
MAVVQELMEQIAVYAITAKDFGLATGKAPKIKLGPKSLGAKNASQSGRAGHTRVQMTRLGRRARGDASWTGSKSKRLKVQTRPPNPRCHNEEKSIFRDDDLHSRKEVHTDHCDLALSAHRQGSDRTSPRKLRGTSKPLTLFVTRYLPSPLD